MFNSLKDKTVLYVEDELDVLENISELLTNYFDKFYTASDGESAYEIFLDNEIDILLVDIELPKMNGIKLIEKIRREEREIHIVVISAYTKTDYLLDCIEHGIDKYIVKPFTSRKIGQLLSKLDEEFKQEELKENNLIVFDDEFSFDKDSNQLLQEGEMVTLTKKERDLLKLFIKNSNQIISPLTMEYAIWPEQESSAGKRRSLVSRLRVKLNHKFIETCSSEGYIFKIEKKNEHRK